MNKCSQEYNLLKKEIHYVHFKKKNYIELILWEKDFEQKNDKITMLR